MNKIFQFSNINFLNKAFKYSAFKVDSKLQPA